MRSREPIPKPRSNFLLVKCSDCGEERIIFSCSTKDIGCKRCGKTLVESRGGKALIFGTVLKRLD